MKKIIKCKCPKCGYEYLIEEIFMPEDMLGKPYNIIKNDKGEIEFFEGNQGELKEDYICDKCGCHFEVTCECVLESNKIKADEFNEEFVAKIYSDRISLEEPK